MLRPEIGNQAGSDVHPSPSSITTPIRNENADSNSKSSSSLKLNHDEPEVEIFVRHLPLVENDHQVGVVKVPPVDEGIALLVSFGDYIILVAVSGVPSWNQDCWLAVVEVIFVKKAGEHGFTRSGRSSDGKDCFFV